LGTGRVATNRIRTLVAHPVVDGDGHALEFMPIVLSILADLAGVSAAEVVRRRILRDGTPGCPRARVFWGTPARNTLDRMTSTIPGLLYRRLDEMGLDFCILYPTDGLIAQTIFNREVRTAACRAFNLYYAESYRQYADRISPVAVIPMFSPDEAVAELDFAVGTLGLKSVVMEGVIPRLRDVDGAESLVFEPIGFEEGNDYDRVWQRCRELGVAPAFHSSAMGWGTRTSTDNYVFNHLGAFAAAQEATCRSLTMGGVPLRFPDLRFQFLEGGMAWPLQLYHDLVGHYEKRNRASVEEYNPKNFDLVLACSLIRSHGSERFRSHLADFERQSEVWMSKEESSTDDFARSGITTAGDLKKIFGTSYAFGCEADDPLNALAFDRTLTGEAVKFSAIFGSDIGHWDVPDMPRVLNEAWELVEGGGVTPDDFREFVFGNVVRTVTASSPDYFEGTSLEADVRELLRMRHKEAGSEA
jgi:predicted TIM-barrel fold metal-dependent hydrolase